MTLASMRIRVLLAGVCSQLLCVGIARFAYTPLLPVMQQQTWLNDSGAGALAAVNYLGYMLGALLSATISDLRLKDRLYRAGLLLGIISTALMAVSTNIYWWSLLRFIAGLSSAAAMLIAAGLIMNWLLRHQLRSELGIHFAGIGGGILLASLLVEGMLRLQLAWDLQWLALGVAALLLLLPAWGWLPRPASEVAAVAPAHMQDRPPPRRYIWTMMAAYFCAGYGYVITTTFIVTIVERQPALAGYGNWAFALIGVAAVPAAIVWDFIARRMGYLGALIVAYSLQIVGIVLPALSDSAALLMFSALCFGATFSGCVSLVLTMVGQLYPSRPAKLMGKMTVSYGAAQVIGPALAGYFAQYSGNYNSGLWTAAAFVLLGALLLAWLRRSESRLAAL